MADDLSARLRSLRDRRNLTVVDMAESTGIPKRTLDKYMTRINPSLPGYEALIALSKGLGVSLDWLVFGNDFASKGSELLAQRAADEIGREYFEALLKAHYSDERPLVSGEEILGLSPEEWASDLAMRVAERAGELSAKGITKEELLLWRSQRSERLGELVEDRIARLRQAHSSSK